MPGKHSEAPGNAGDQRQVAVEIHGADAVDDQAHTWTVGVEVCQAQGPVRLHGTAAEDHRRPTYGLMPVRQDLADRRAARTVEHHADRAAPVVLE